MVTAVVADSGAGVPLSCAVREGRVRARRSGLAWAQSCAGHFLWCRLVEVEAGRQSC